MTPEYNSIIIFICLIGLTTHAIMHYVMRYLNRPNWASLDEFAECVKHVGEEIRTIEKITIGKKAVKKKPAQKKKLILADPYKYSLGMRERNDLWRIHDKRIAKEKAVTKKKKRKSKK